MDKKGNFGDMIFVIYIIFLGVVFIGISIYSISNMYETMDKINKVCNKNERIPDSSKSTQVDSTHYNCYRGTEVILEDGIYKEKPIYEPVEVKK